MDIRVRIIKEILEKRGWSQKKFAEKMHCSPGLVSQYLNSGDAPEHFFKRAVKVLDSAKLRMIIFGDTTSPVYFDQAYIAPHSSLDKMEEEALQLVDYIQELKRKRNYHNARNHEECSKELKKAYMKVAEKNKDVNHCTEHVDIALDEFGVDLEKRDRKCNLKYIDRKYVSSKTVITKKRHLL